MKMRLRWLILLLPWLAFPGSAIDDSLPEILARPITITAEPLAETEFAHSKHVRLLGAWELRARDDDFGGISALLRDGSGLLALSDKGLMFRIAVNNGKPGGRGEILPLPPGCTKQSSKAQRDSESLARDLNGDVLIGFEIRNAICRSLPDLSHARANTVPKQMRGWPRTGGPEAMTMLADGRTLVIAERGWTADGTSPLLLFQGDPTAPGAGAAERRYMPPNGYRPTDVVELPDGSLLVVNRRFRLPFEFSVMLTRVAAGAINERKLFRGKPIALFMAPGLTENFEALAIEQQAGKTIVWLASDDNYVPTQRTIILKLEIDPN